MTFYSGNTYNLKRSFSIPDSSPIQYIEPTSMTISIKNINGVDMAGSPITIDTPSTYLVTEGSVPYYVVPYEFPEGVNSLKIYWEGVYLGKQFEFIEEVKNIKT